MSRQFDSPVGDFFKSLTAFIIAFIVPIALLAIGAYELGIRLSDAIDRIPELYCGKPQC